MSKNERILDKLVHREVIHNLGCTMQMIFANPDCEDWDAAMIVSERILDNSDEIEEIEAIIEDKEEGLAVIERMPIGASSKPDMIIVKTDLERELKDAETEKEQLEEDQEPQECLEFWAVSSWMASELKTQGESVADILDFHVWGRTCSGQSISMDGCIKQIAENMEILEGQSNEWSV